MGRDLLLKVRSQELLKNCNTEPPWYVIYHISDFPTDPPTPCLGS